MIRPVLALLVLLPIGSLSRAADIYVNNVFGDDTRDGTAAETTGSAGPCRTISRALKLVQPGDQIILAKTEEPYRESITLQAAIHSGTPGRPFQLLGNGATLDGTQVVPKDKWEHVMGDIFRYQPPRTSFQMLYLAGKPLSRKAALKGEGLPPLEPLEWSLYDRHIYFRVEAGRLPRQYELHYAHLSVGITLYEVRHVIIRDLVLQGFQLDGLNAHDSVFDATVQGITSRGNGRSGVSIGGACRVSLVDSLVGDNGVAQVRTEGYCKAEILNCDLLDNTAPGLVREGGQVIRR